MSYDGIKLVMVTNTFNQSKIIMHQMENTTPMTSEVFLKLINALIKATGLYSVRKLMKEGRVTKERLREILKPLKNDGGGYTMPNLLQTLSE